MILITIKTAITNKSIENLIKTEEKNGVEAQPLPLSMSSFSQKANYCSQEIYIVESDYKLFDLCLFLFLIYLIYNCIY